MEVASPSPAAADLGAGQTGSPTGDCPPADLQVNLTTGVDDSGIVLGFGAADSTWEVIVDPSGGSVPRPADAISPNPAWVTEPGSSWISADKFGPNGSYTYRTCWCMDDQTSNPQLDVALRADDQAELFLNGVPIASLPGGTFNDAAPTVVNVSDPSLFQSGQNCLDVVVENTFAVVTGFNLVGEVTADDGLCCACDPQDFSYDASTGVDDATGNTFLAGQIDDTWTVTQDASGGPVPREPRVDAAGAWDTIPGTMWISANTTGPNGLYEYEYCWCLAEGFQDPSLYMELLADDEADVFLNDKLIQSTGPGAFTFPATTIQTNDPTLFQPGENCITVQVENTDGVITGMNAALMISAAQGECCDCADLPTSAEGWWKFDEQNGSTAFEEVNAHDGTWVDAIGSLPSPTPVNGYVSKALNFDGIDDHVVVPDALGLNFDIGQDFSIDAWIRTLNDAPQWIAAKQDPVSGAGYTFGTSGGALELTISDGSNSVVCTGGSGVADAAWHFVAATIDRDDPAGIRLIIDGVVDQVCDPTPVTGSLSNTQPLTFGGVPGLNRFFRGPIDELELFRSALPLQTLQQIYRAEHSGKCTFNDCQGDGGPVCDGGCPNGQQCTLRSFIGFDVCECEPEPPPCGDTFPVCDGACRTGEVCSLNATGDDCGCIPEPPPACGDSFFPECDGACPPGEICERIGLSDLCGCTVQEPCEASQFPVCGGACPGGEQCVPDSSGTDMCFCEPVTTSCEDSPYPTCGGVCPAGETCADSGDPALGCQCEPEIVQCEESEFPVCDGECPDGSACKFSGDAALGCLCEPTEPTSCEDTRYPECDGSCPDGQTCENKPGSDKCFCADPKPVCGDAEAPVCDGLCPDDQACIKDADGGCECRRCLDITPKGDAVIAWQPDGFFRWTSASCATAYNTYRLTGATIGDADGDGLADSYGDCLQNDVLGNLAPDGEIPPLGQLFWYLVSGQNVNGEGNLGLTGAGTDRDLSQAGQCPE